MWSESTGKKKQRTSLNKNVTDVYRSTKDLMSKKCEHFKSAMLVALRKNKFAGHTCIWNTQPTEPHQSGKKN